MNKEKAMEYQAIAKIHNITASNGMDAKDIILNACQINERKYYRVIQKSEKYYTGYIQEIEEKEEKVRELRRKGESIQSIAFQLDVSKDFVNKARLK